jgi:maltose phosphorylase
MKKYLEKHPWKIIEKSLIAENNLVSESIASLGNGRLGGRGNFEEKFNGPTLQGSYIAGIYYPDKTKVGWWKNGYPEYFAKVLNSVNWIGIDVWVDDFDYEITPSKIIDYHAELDMQEGVLRRSMITEVTDGKQIKIEAERFYSMTEKDQCYLKYSITPINFSGKIKLIPYLDFNIKNQDSNYEETFWEQKEHGSNGEWAFTSAVTKKTNFVVFAGMKNKLFINHSIQETNLAPHSQSGFASHTTEEFVDKGSTLTLEKTVCITSTFYYDESQLKNECHTQLHESFDKGYDYAKNNQVDYWKNRWKESDIIIEGDVAAQQGIRFNIFQLHQTYTGEDHRLNIGPKGFTGEKYGGSTYWDTEAYCLPFYMSNSPSLVSKNLLAYRYNHLPKAIENAQKLGFDNGAALYPMVTMNGEECHNEWEITFEEIHRNGAIAYAIFDYIRYTGDENYLVEGGLEVLIAIARFWAQRVNWSKNKNQYVILGVTGPNEYENNVNNNWYTNYIASWCLKYASDCINNIKEKNQDAYNNIIIKTTLDEEVEVSKWMDIIANMYYPTDEELGIFLQQDSFLDKDIKSASEIPADERPIHEHWSWDRILRSCFIKQADVLQGLYFFENDFDTSTIQKNFEYYEPLTVHESSLSPCVHSILACKIGKFDKAYEMYLRTARLDLDDYNNDTCDGLHITSMAGTWMSIAKGFGGMTVHDGLLHFDPYLPEQWESYSFKIRFREHVLQINVSKLGTTIENDSENDIKIILKGVPIFIQPNGVESLNLIA